MIWLWMTFYVSMWIWIELCPCVCSPVPLFVSLLVDFAFWRTSACHLHYKGGLVTDGCCFWNVSMNGQVMPRYPSLYSCVLGFQCMTRNFQINQQVFSTVAFFIRYNLCSETGFICVGSSELLNLCIELKPQRCTWEK